MRKVIKGGGKAIWVSGYEGRRAVKANYVFGNVIKVEIWLGRLRKGCR